MIKLFRRARDFFLLLKILGKDAITSSVSSTNTITCTPITFPLARREILQMVAARTNSNHREPELPFEPCYLFFYGSLMDAEVLQTIAGLPEVPAVQEGSVTGLEMRMWGIYPTLIPCAGAQVSGTVWKVNEPGHFFRLQKYETSAYTWCSCEIRLSNGELLRGCRTFCWAGEVNSKELKQGNFDLEHYQKYFKASVVRKAPYRRPV